MATQKIKTVAGNTAPPLTLTATRNGSAISLADANRVDLIITRGATTTNTGHQQAIITNASAGTVSYVRQTGDIATAGSYICDLKITYNDGTWEVLFDQLKVKARKPAGT